MPRVAQGTFPFGVPVFQKNFFFSKTVSRVIFDADHESDIVFAIWGIFTNILSTFTKIFKKIFFDFFIKKWTFSIKNNKEHQNNYFGGMNSNIDHPFF